MASFYESGHGSNYLCVVEHEDIHSRIDPDRKRKMRDVAIVRRKTPNVEKGVGEFKFFPSNGAVNYRKTIASRLSDLHYLQDVAATYNMTTFFLDVVLNPNLVGGSCYGSLSTMCRNVSDLLHAQQIPMSSVVQSRGFKSYFQMAADRTTRARKRKFYGNYLFPCMDIDLNGQHLRGSVLIRKPDSTTGLVSIGVRRPKTKHVSKPEQLTPYMPLPNGQIGAVCFAVFSPNGKLELTTVDVI